MIPQWVIITFWILCLPLGYVAAVGVDGAAAIAKRLWGVGREDVQWWLVILLGTWVTVSWVYPQMLKTCEWC